MAGDPSLESVLLSEEFIPVSLILAYISLALITWEGREGGGRRREREGEGGRGKGRKRKEG